MPQYVFAIRAPNEDARAEQAAVLKDDAAALAYACQLAQELVQSAGARRTGGISRRRKASEGAVLDHSIPCLAFTFEEKLRVNVRRQGLSRLGLRVGPWLREAKRAVRQGAPDHSEVCVHDGQAISLGDLKQHALRTAPGQKIAYAVDLAYNERNIEKVVALARDADQLFIEAPFLDADANIAAERWHLTARQAGDIAKRACVARLIPFHFSARYRERANELTREAEATSAAAE